jgi:hypothetical protein
MKLAMIIFIVNTATSLGNMKKTDSNFRSHSVYTAIFSEYAVEA